MRENNETGYFMAKKSWEAKNTYRRFGTYIIV
jgi:hypothetical protein